MDENSDANELLIVANDFLQKANFEDALKYYYYVEKGAAKNLIDKSLTETCELYKNCIILYLVMEECLILARKNELEKLKEKLDFLYYEKSSLLPRISSERLASFIERNYHYLVGYYMYNFYKNKFLREYENIYYFMHAGWTEKATNHYNNHLLRHYNHLAKYGDFRVRNILYNAVINLNREIKLNSLKQQAYSEIAMYNFARIKKEKTREKIERTPRNIKTTEIIRFEKKPFKRLHELIQENKADDARVLYDKLLQPNWKPEVKST